MQHANEQRLKVDEEVRDIEEGCARERERERGGWKIEN